MNPDYLEAVKNRRSVYAISKEKKVPEERITEIVKESVLYAPTAFNSQSARVLVLFGSESDKLWSIVRDELRKVVPEANFGETAKKIEALSNGYGTILYFEDQSVVEGLQKKFPLYRENFPVWSQQSSGMLQLIIWTALEAEGLGVTLQHYNPLIDGRVRSEWKVAENWKLIAEMPFGAPAGPAGEKSFAPVDERVFVFGK